MARNRFGKLIAALILSILLFQFMPGGVPPPDGVKAKGPTAESKISGLLKMQVDAKLKKIKTGSAPAAMEAAKKGNEYEPLEALDIDPEKLDKQQVFVHFAQKPTQQQVDDLQASGVTVYPESWIPPVGGYDTGFVLADMPIEKLSALAEKNYVNRLNTAEQQFEPQNDLATQKINADDVWSSGYTGAGVRIAVLDSGLDTTHPDIPTPADSKDYGFYPALDDTIANTVSGHGTHVTGSVLGRGTASGGVYKGSAPGADLIFLKIGRDTTSSATTAAMVGAILAATDTYSADIITISYGGWDDYHDGSTEEAQAIDYAVSRGVTVLVSAGNNGGAGWHYSGSVSAGSTTDFFQLNVANAGTNNTFLQFNLVWYDGIGTRNDLALEYYNSTFNLIASTSDTQTESPRGTESEYSWYNNYLPAGSGTYYVKVRNYSGSAQFFHIYQAGSGVGSVTFQNPDSLYTITAPADADSAIAVGAYTTRRSWYGYDNSLLTSTLETNDQIATFSSRGPRIDTGAPGKPNIVAPGKNIISARDNVIYPWSSRTYYYVDNNGPNRSNASGGSNDGLGPADYYVMGGTSMACPIAAGAAALILQAHPNWTPSQVKYALQSTAVDQGTVGPDPVYGSGLVNALAALSATPLEVTTNAADNLTTNSARLFGNLNSTGGLSSANVSFVYGTVSGNLNQTSSNQSRGTGTYFADITGLTKDTVYYFRAVAVGEYSVSGTELSFRTNKLPPSVTTTNATAVGLTSATLNGVLNSLGDYTSANVSFAWGVTSGNLNQTTANQSMLSTGNFSANITGLITNTIYYFRSIASADGNTFGSELSFTTAKTPPSVVTTNATAVSLTSATLNGVLNSLGDYTSANASFQWGTTSGNLNQTTANQSMLSTGNFSANITGLITNTIYYFRAIASADGNTFGSELSFTTAKAPPSVVTTNATAVSLTSATLNGSLAGLGDYTSSNVSFIYSTISGSLNLTTANQTIGSTGNFSANVTGLSGNMTYYFRAVASSGNATVFGNELSFATKTISSLSVTPAGVALFSGQTRQFTANATFSDATTGNVTSSVNWSSSNTSVAIISPGGLATAIAGGNTTITATSGAVSGNVTLDVVTSVDVNSGSTIAVVNGETRGNIPVNINGLPNLGPGNGLATFQFDLAWDKNVVHVNSANASPSALAAGWSIFPGTANNTAGNMTVTGSTPTYSSANLTPFTLNITAVGTTGNLSAIGISISDLGDNNTAQIPATSINASVQIISLVADTRLSQGLSSNVSGVIAIKVKIQEIQNPANDEKAVIPGGIGSYYATANSTDNTSLQFVRLYGVPPYNYPTFDNVTGNFSVASVALPAQPDDSTVAEIVAILTGNTTTSLSLLVHFQTIMAAEQPGLNVPEVSTNNITFRRGDANNDGSVSIGDALFIAQYIVGQRALSGLNALNAASVSHDGVNGDRITIGDALFIAQKIVGQKNGYFQ